MNKSNYPRCKTCRFYYDQVGDHQINDHPLAECTSPLVYYGYESAKSAQAQARRGGLIVESDEGWGISPGPEFGCIHHEPRES